MTRKQWTALLLAGMLLIITACGSKSEPGNSGPSTSPPVTDTNPDLTPAPEPTLEACQPPPAPEVTAGHKLVTVFYACGEMESPTVPIAVSRVVPETEPDLTAALGALLAGPTEAEQTVGFRSWFSEATAGRLISVSVDEGGHAVVNFANFSHIIPNASTSAGGEHLMAEIGATIAQFPEVNTIELQFDGSCDMFGEWQQTGCISVEAAQYR